MASLSLGALRFHCRWVHYGFTVLRDFKFVEKIDWDFSFKSSLLMKNTEAATGSVL